MDHFNFGGSELSRGNVFQMFLRISIASVITYYSVKWMMNQLDPTSKNKKKAKLLAEEQLKRLSKENNFNVNVQTFTDYELMIASHLIVPADITVKWSDIAGLDSVIQDLRESVVLPVRHRDLFKESKLWQAPRGVLLHGPPGCGKTLIAKATAKEAGMRFINLDVAILTDKWYGESQKLASAVFSLAAKIQPCIIFVDEIDSFLRARNSNDHEATAMMKTQFMMLWDGLSTNPNSAVIVMGATNRPQDLDKAILRRMPAQFHISLPSEVQRIQILKLILETEEVDRNVDFNRLAKLTNGFSGSDLREMCRNASVYRMRQFMRANDKPEKSSNLANSNTDKSLISITMDDLLNSHLKMKESKMHTGNLFLENRIDLD
ncbi:PREDICTED: ATPase family AAA domain-containing protein 1 [Drosophila arizonae]|uniref:ATPase family AAA domain-containing protein 1 n=1 Tax=Drosophila arizonae TaxID=7263 RepID=A0ABM1NZH7_DROAR|nr:PREDICTED: ATPase family AAA domain-containing protein 1 [Drosophila arizonae]